MRTEVRAVTGVGAWLNLTLTHILTHIHTNMHTHAHTHTNIHTHIPTFTHTYIQYTPRRQTAMSTVTLVTQSLLQSWLQTDPEPRHAGETLVDAIRHALPASYESAGKQMAAELATERRANPALADVISAAMIREQNAVLDRSRLVLHQHIDPAQGLRQPGWRVFNCLTWTRKGSRSKGDQMVDEHGVTSHTGKTPAPSGRLTSGRSAVHRTARGAQGWRSSSLRRQHWARANPIAGRRPM